MYTYAKAVAHNEFNKNSCVSLAAAFDVMYKSAIAPLKDVNPNVGSINHPITL